MTVLVTGGTGFVGAQLVRVLASDPSCSVRVLARRPAADLPGRAIATVADLAGPDSTWAGSLDGANAVVHLAARVHVMRDRARDPIDEFRRINVDGTMALASQAARAGVRRFVFVSSVKVHGEAGCFRETDRLAPTDPYGVSKLEAELELRDLQARTGMEIVVVRPPLVYGPGVRANFRSLVKAVQRGIPLPFGAAQNRRSLVSRQNLVDFLRTCLIHPRAANETYLVSDGLDLSTADMIRQIAQGLGRPPRLVPVPPWVLHVGARLVGRRDVMQRLLGSLQVDITKARTQLAWSPPQRPEDGLREAARSFGHL